MPLSTVRCYGTTARIALLAAAAPLTWRWGRTDYSLLAPRCQILWFEHPTSKPMVSLIAPRTPADSQPVEFMPYDPNASPISVLQIGAERLRACQPLRMLLGTRVIAGLINVSAGRSALETTPAAWRRSVLRSLTNRLRRRPSRFATDPASHTRRDERARASSVQRGENSGSPFSSNRTSQRPPAFLFAFAAALIDAWRCVTHRCCPEAEVEHIRTADREH